MSSPFAGAAHAPALDQPLGIAASGGHVWVANARGNSVSEFDVTSGALVRTIPRSTYGFATPIGIGTNRSNLWVANKSANSLTELSAKTGALERIVKGPSYHFSDPGTIPAVR